MVVRLAANLLGHIEHLFVDFTNGQPFLLLRLRYEVKKGLISDASCQTLLEVLHVGKSIKMSEIGVAFLKDVS